MHSKTSFLQFWWTDRTRDTFLSCVPKDDLASLRLACHDFSVRAAPVLFEEIAVTFRPSIFTKPTRMAALGRIGQHVRSFHFKMPHGPETFLPPLLDPVTGEETPFNYEPYIQTTRDSGSRHSNPLYGSWEMTDMLVKQYSPLFHAAANVPSFIRTFSSIPNLKHLKISCPGQEPNQRYRRGIVDYALISLRIAVERSKLLLLDTLSLLDIHPGAALYLNPSTSFGASPTSVRRWRQIRKLTIQMDTVSLGSPTDHLKLLHNYLQMFAASLEKFRFRWLGAKGPCPLSLGTETCLETSSPGLACPRTKHLALRPLVFKQVQALEVENVLLDASQISSFITSHRHNVRHCASFELNFENTHLRTGSWDEALAPLTRISGNDKWKGSTEEVMEVPLMLSPTDFEQEQLSRVWDDHLRARKSNPLHGALHRAGAKGRELLFGTEEHMRRFLRTDLSIFGWR